MCFGGIFMLLMLKVLSAIVFYISQGGLKRVRDFQE